MLLLLVSILPSSVGCPKAFMKIIGGCGGIGPASTRRIKMNAGE